jgi:hypothetical protein
VNGPSGIGSSYGYADEGYENGSKRCISFAELLLRVPRQPDQLALSNNHSKGFCVVWFLVLECATATNHTRTSVA